jgi:ADP-heptose:LPS heptosyltransferase
MNLRTQRKVDNYVGRLAIAALRPATMLLGRILRRNHDLTIGAEVVWIKMLGGGSLILAMPMLLGFRRAYPGARMVLVTTPAVKPFAELTGVFDEYRVIDVRRIGPLIVTAMRTWWATLRADCIIDLEVHSRMTTVFTTLTMARNRVSFWLEDIFWRRGLASHLVFYNRASGSFFFYDRIADLFGFSIAGRQECRAAIARGAEAPAGEPFVSVGHACSDLSRERMLSPTQWVEVFSRHLRPEHRRFVLLGGPADRVAAEEIIAALSANFPALEFEHRCGTTSLRDSVSILFQSTEFWGIDSSLLHIARIGGLPCVSYWGPTDPATLLRPSWGLTDTIVYRKIACSPCVHTSNEPPCHGDNRCIEGLFNPERSPLDWTPIEHPGPLHAIARR